MTVAMLLLTLLFAAPHQCYANQAPQVSVQTMKNYTTAVAYVEKVDKHLAFAVVETESKWNPSLHGDSGRSMGLFQIQCPAAKEVGFTGNCKELTYYKTNIVYGIKYLKLQVFKHGVRGGVAAYNAGQPRKSNGVYMNQEYVDKTMGYYYASKKQSRIKS